jgi:hypothetical protein
MPLFFSYSVKSAKSLPKERRRRETGGFARRKYLSGGDTAYKTFRAGKVRYSVDNRTSNGLFRESVTRTIRVRHFPKHDTPNSSRKEQSNSEIGRFIGCELPKTCQALF